MGTQSPPHKGGGAPQIFGPSLLWPNCCMDQDATWYRGRPRPTRPRPTRHCVRCGPSYPQKKGTPTPTQFLARLLWPYGWMDEDAAWYGSRPRPRPHCTRRGPSSRERDTAAPFFCGPCLLWPRSSISATAELLYNLTPVSTKSFASWFHLK